MKTSFKTRVLGAAFGVGAIFGGVALAQDGPDIEATGNVAITTNYLFRGLSQSDAGPAVSGGFDLSSNIFYAGTWASSLGFGGGAPMELDFYAGLKPTTGPIAWDIGVIYYSYPGADDDAAEFNFYEGYLKGSATLAPGFSVGAAVSYSPDFFGESDTGLYYEGNVSFAVTPALSISGAVGQQSIDDVNGPGPGTPDDDYITWNAGATYTMPGGWAFDLRYVDTDIDGSAASTDAIITSGFTIDRWSEEQVVFTIKKAL